MKMLDKDLKKNIDRFNKEKVCIENLLLAKIEKEEEIE